MNKKWEQVLKVLWERSRFTSYFYQSVQISENNNFPTIALTAVSSRLVLYYNSSFIENLYFEHILGLMVHEMFHVILNHRHREIPGEDPFLQNLAQDMTINSYLDKNDEYFFSHQGDYMWDVPVLQLPPGLPMVPRKFYRETGNHDPSWEEVYRWLKDQQKNDLPEVSGAVSGFEDENAAASSGEGEDGAPPGVPMGERDKLPPREKNDTWEGIVFKNKEGEDMPTGSHLFRNSDLHTLLESKKKQIIALAEGDFICKEERMFCDIRGIIEKIEEVDTTSWRREIKSIVDYSSQSDEFIYTYSRFNRRFFAGGLYAPGRVFRHMDHLTVAVDVSASMVTSPRDLEAAFGVIEALMGKYIIHLLCIDEELFVPRKRGEEFVRGEGNAPYLYRRGDWQYIRTGSSGTTFFEPLFNSYMKGHREMLMVITDGYVYDLDRLDRYCPTLWVISEEREQDFAHPFGKSVQIRH